MSYFNLVLVEFSTRRCTVDTLSSEAAESLRSIVVKALASSPLFKDCQSSVLAEIAEKAEVGMLHWKFLRGDNRTPLFDL